LRQFDKDGAAAPERVYYRTVPAIGKIAVLIEFIDLAQDEFRLEL